MKRPETDETARIGVYAVGARVEGELGWIFREQPVSDLGIDAHMEVVEPDHTVKGQLIAAQIKSGASYFSESQGDGFVYRGKRKHLQYWLHHVLPVIVVLHDPVGDMCYWQAVTRETVSLTRGGWKLLIPMRQTLDASAATALRELAETAKEPHERRLAKLLLQKPLMDLLGRGERLFLSVDEWVNKTSGRGSVRLFIVDEAEKEETVADWPFVYFGLLPYRELIPEIFRWASISVDEEFYEQYDEEVFDDNFGIWDSEDKQYIGHWADYGEWKAGLPAIRPYQVAAGELAQYRLELTLGDIGQAFLSMEPFLLRGETINERAVDAVLGTRRKSFAARKQPRKD